MGKIRFYVEKAPLVKYCMEANARQARGLAVPTAFYRCVDKHGQFNGMVLLLTHGLPTGELVDEGLSLFLTLEQMPGVKCIKIVCCFPNAVRQAWASRDRAISRAIVGHWDGVTRSDQYAHGEHGHGVVDIFEDSTTE